MTDSKSRRGALSERLSKLRSYYSGERHVWDIGCDHGLLGLSFENVETVERIHLVDPSESVIQALKKRLLDSYITNAIFHHQKGQEIKINSPSNCIFIAGMGGTEVGDIIRHLLKSLDESSRIVISPHRKILELRSLLHKLPLELIKEEVIEEGAQFYQILVLRKNETGPKVPLYGDDLWKSPIGMRYLEHQLKYFSAHRDELSRDYMTFLIFLKKHL